MKVGFIGLGNVGGKLAGSLLRNGTDITVCDLNADLVDSFTAQGAKGTMTPADLMQRCDIVITCLPSPAASDAVMGDLLPHVTGGKIWMEMSTTDEAEVKRLGAKLSKPEDWRRIVRSRGMSQGGYWKYQYFCRM